MRVLIALLVASAAVAAQTDTVEVEPIICWWRTTATSIRVGEPFTVILTCAVLETDAARVIPDESRLDPSVVQLPPFEVLGGTRAKDVTTATRRFVQFDYRLRVIAENVFAATVNLPALDITYRVESRVGGADSVQGRDQSYALPALGIRVLSTVPDNAGDIREAPVATFDEVDDLRVRGVMQRVAAWVLVGLGVLLLLLALVGAARRRRAVSSRARLLPDAAILQGARRELTTIKDQARSGWTSDLAGRALAALRIVAAYAVGRQVTQTLTTRRRRSGNADAHASTIAAGHPGATNNANGIAGQLVVNGRFGASALVSAAVTAQHADADLRDALARFAAVRYGREAEIDGRLDDSLDVAIRTVDRLIANRPAWERVWPR